VIGLAGVAAWVLAVATCVAVEQWQPFLERLRQAQMYDQALAYLDRMAASPWCPPELKEALDYEAGVTLIAQSRTLGSPMARAEALDAAHARLSAFLASHRDHSAAAGAALQLVNVLVERGRMKTTEAGRPAVSPAERDRLLEEARSHFVDARRELASQEQRLLEVLKGLPKGLIDPRERQLREKRDQVQLDLRQARITLAAVIYEQATAHPIGTQDRTALLAEAADRFAALYEKYGAKAPYALMRLGQCRKELGQYKQAMEAFDELLEQEGDEGPIRDLKTMALILAIQTVLESKDEKPSDAIQRYEAWKRAVPRTESSPEALSAHFFAARAYLEAARARKAKDPARRTLANQAREALEFVARFPGDHRRDAKLALLDPIFGKPELDETEPVDFTEARDRGLIAFERARMAELQIRTEPRESAKNQARLQREIAEGQASAEKYYRMALGMVTPETPAEDVNAVRYHLSILYLNAKRYYDAAVMGEFLANRYPQSTMARPGARVALGALAQLYNAAAPGPARTAAHARMVAAADAITSRWPTSPEAGDAQATLVQIAIVEGRLEAAREYLARLPAEAPGRGLAELRVGRALWDTFLRTPEPKEPAEPTPPQADHPPGSPAQRQAMLDEARRLLADGLAKLPEGTQADTTLLAAVLSLVQIQLRDGHPEQAVELLENGKFGPVTLAEARHPAAAGPQTAQAIYQTALRAYVAAGRLEKAEKAMNALEKAVGTGDTAAASTLTQIYVALGRELQRSLDELRQEGKTREMSKVADGFELFLNRIAQREAGNTFHSLLWVAQTYAEMAAGFDTGGTPPPKEAKKYYEKAAEVYQKILDRAKTDKEFLPAGSAWSVEVGLATCRRRLGQYKEALDQLVAVLVERDRMIDAQIQAAYTYQQWAATPGNARYYQFAIQGGQARQVDGQRVNVVWGWGKIAKMVGRWPKYADLFHEARYNLALCRFEYALTLSGAEKKSTLRQAERDITVTAMLYPKMGGPAWRDKYDALLKKIQGLLGQTPAGLPKGK